MKWKLLAIAAAIIGVTPMAAWGLDGDECPASVKRILESQQAFGEASQCKLICDSDDDDATCADLDTKISKATQQLKLYVLHNAGPCTAGTVSFASTPSTLADDAGRIVTDIAGAVIDLDGAGVSELNIDLARAQPH